VKTPLSHPKSPIGFVSTRLAGTDGVTLETWKWVRVLEDWGHECFYFAGEIEAPQDRSWVVPEAHFQYPDIQRIQQDLFDDLRRDLSLPMNVPLGLALTEYIAETGIVAVGHHHDFYWERNRFLVNAAADYLQAAFPPALPSLRHVVISTLAQRHLAWHTGITSMVIPNVMDFEHPPREDDGYAADLRQELDIPEDAFFILQPTRIVPRKRIERAIELVRRLELPAVLVISHAAGDEGWEYKHYLEEFAQLLKVPVRFAADRISRHRGQDPQGRKIYSLADVYHQADLVTYPSDIEGFGNAFLEAIYYKRPIVCNLYAIFRLDIQPKGFRVLTFDEYINDRVVEEAREVLLDPGRRRLMVEHNYQLGLRHFSMSTLERHLAVLVSMCMC